MKRRKKEEEEEEERKREREWKKYEIIKILENFSRY